MALKITLLITLSMLNVKLRSENFDHWQNFKLLYQIHGKVTINEQMNNFSRTLLMRENYP